MTLNNTASHQITSYNCYSTPCCIQLHSIPTHYATLQYITFHSITLQYITLHCNTITYARTCVDYMRTYLYGPTDSWWGLTCLDKFYEKRSKTAFQGSAIYRVGCTTWVDDFCARNLRWNFCCPRLLLAKFAPQSFKGLQHKSCAEWLTGVVLLILVDAR